MKDAFDDYVVHGRVDAVNPAAVGTKTAAHHRVTLGAGEHEVELWLENPAGRPLFLVRGTLR